MGPQSHLPECRHAAAGNAPRTVPWPALLAHSREPYSPAPGSHRSRRPVGPAAAPSVVVARAPMLRGAVATSKRCACALAVHPHMQAASDPSRTLTDEQLATIA